MKLLRFALICAVAVAGFGLAGESSYAKEKLPKAIKKVAGKFDESDPVQAAVLAALTSFEDGFAPLVGDPLSPERREQMIQDTLAFPAFDQSKSQMDRLREAEIFADTMRHVTVTIPNANGYYWAQEVIQPGAKSRMEGVYWTFDVPFDERIAFARDLYGRLGGALAKDKKWMQQQVTDPNVNSLYGQMMYFYMLNMMGSEMVFVTVEYGQTEQVHNLEHGVKVQVYTLDTFT